jgi:hypothetical protein
VNSAPLWPTEQQAVETRVLSSAVVAAIGIFLLLQAAFGSWRLAALIFLSLPMALVGGVLAVFAGGGVVLIGSLAGFLAVFGIAVRHAIGLIRHYQNLGQHNRAGLDMDAALRGTKDQLAPIMTSMTAATVALLPILFLGDVPGLEIVHPMAVVIIGGLITSTLFNMFVLPALYVRFGLAQEPPSVTDARPVEPVPQEVSVPAGAAELTKAAVVTRRDVDAGHADVGDAGHADVRAEADDHMSVEDPSYEVFDEAFDKIIDEARAMSERLRRQANGDSETSGSSSGEGSGSGTERKNPSAGSAAGD